VGGTRRAELHSSRELGQWAAQGGNARAARYSKRQLRAWSRLGGRPVKLDRQTRANLERQLAKGTSQGEVARMFGISLRTVGRIVARTKAES
jgi:DNA-directed RNA polymerase specialized sigma24 family protein